eukprot:SAG11_NODE_12345_length_708_cov_0.671593_1_plen_183_part_00
MSNAIGRVLLLLGWCHVAAPHSHIIQNIAFPVDEDAGTLSCLNDNGDMVRCYKVDVVFSIDGVLAGFMFEITGSPIYKPPLGDHIMGTRPGNSVSNTVFPEMRVTVDKNPKSAVYSQLVSVWSFQQAYVDSARAEQWHLATLYAGSPSSIELMWLCAHGCGLGANETCWGGRGGDCALELQA